VVDDDPSVRKGLTRLIKAAGHEVEAFAAGWIGC
jgi:FixJ family two-component response regulator